MPIRYLGLDLEVITETPTPDRGFAFSISSPASGGKYPFASVAAGDDGRITQGVSRVPSKVHCRAPGARLNTLVDPAIHLW